MVRMLGPTMDQFRTTFSLRNNAHPQRGSTERIESIRHCVQKMVYPLYGRLCKSVLVFGLTKSKLKPNNQPARLMFGSWAQNEIATDPDSISQNDTVNEKSYIAMKWCGQSLVETIWRYKPYIQRNNKFIEANSRWVLYRAVGCGLAVLVSYVVS